MDRLRPMLPWHPFNRVLHPFNRVLHQWHQGNYFYFILGQRCSESVQELNEDELMHRGVYGQSLSLDAPKKFPSDQHCSPWSYNGLRPRRPKVTFSCPVKRSKAARSWIKGQDEMKREGRLCWYERRKWWHSEEDNIWTNFHSPVSRKTWFWHACFLVLHPLPAQVGF